MVRLARVGSNLLALDGPMLACKGMTQIPLALSLDCFGPVLDNAQIWPVARPAADAIAAHFERGVNQKRTIAILAEISLRLQEPVCS